MESAGCCVGKPARELAFATVSRHSNFRPSDGRKPRLVDESSEDFSASLRLRASAFFSGGREDLGLSVRSVGSLGGRVGFASLRLCDFAFEISPGIHAVAEEDAQPSRRKSSSGSICVICGQSRRACLVVSWCLRVLVVFRWVGGSVFSLCLCASVVHAIASVRLYSRGCHGDISSPLKAARARARARR